MSSELFEKNYGNQSYLRHLRAIEKLTTQSYKRPSIEGGDGGGSPLYFNPLFFNSGSMPGSLPRKLTYMVISSSMPPGVRT